MQDLPFSFRGSFYTLFLNSILSIKFKFYSLIPKVSDDFQKKQIFDSFTVSYAIYFPTLLC